MLHPSGRGGSKGIEFCVSWIHTSISYTNYCSTFVAAATQPNVLHAQDKQATSNQRRGGGTESRLPRASIASEAMEILFSPSAIQRRLSASYCRHYSTRRQSYDTAEDVPHHMSYLTLLQRGTIGSYLSRLPP